VRVNSGANIFKPWISVPALLHCKSVNKVTSSPFLLSKTQTPLLFPFISVMLYCIF